MNENSAGAGGGRSFDWEAIRQRVAEANTALEESIEISPEELEQIWAQRAANLARAPTDEDEGEQMMLVLVRLGCEVYGIDAQHVSYIRTADRITFVPRVPEWVTGVINLRGSILSVVDLRQFFGLPPAKIVTDNDSQGQAMSYIVVVETSDMEVALLTDDVLTVESVAASRIQDTSGVVRGLRPEYVRGVLMRNAGDADKAGDVDEEAVDSMLVVLDLVALLSDERWVVHEEII